MHRVHHMLDTSTVHVQVVNHRHVATATTNLLKALHFERFFGQPIAAFTAAHNAARAEVNDRTVRGYAHEAGRYAFFAGETLDYWHDRYPEATTVERIADAMTAGWHEAARVLDVEVR